MIFFNLIISVVHKDLSSKLKPKVQIKDEFIYMYMHLYVYHELIGEAAFQFGDK